MSDNNEVLNNQPDEITDISASQVDPSNNDQLGESDTIPKKFVGKSYDEIAESYSEVEKHAGRLSSELGQERKRAEDLEDRLKTLEARLNSQPIQQPQAPQHVAQPQQDPYDTFEELWEEDPKVAMKQMLKRQEEMTHQHYQALQQQRNVESANEYYVRQKAENPDYARREKNMQQLLMQYKDAFSDVNSRQVYELLDLASQGADRKYYEETALKRAKQHKQTVVDQKKQAYTESPYSEGEEAINIDDIPLDELRKMLPKSDDYIE